MIAVDTNIIIRFLTHDDEGQYKKAFSIFNTEEVFISDTVILETEWVLRYAYEFSPEDICDALGEGMGDGDLRAATRSSYSLGHKSRQATVDSGAKTPAKQNGSKELATASLEIFGSAFAGSVKVTSADICFNLPVPLVRYKFLIPLGEMAEIRFR